MSPIHLVCSQLLIISNAFMFRFFKQADSSKLSKRKMMEKIEPLCVDIWSSIVILVLMAMTIILIMSIVDAVA